MIDELHHDPADDLRIRAAIGNILNLAPTANDVRNGVFAIRDVRPNRSRQPYVLAAAVVLVAGGIAAVAVRADRAGRVSTATAPTEPSSPNASSETTVGRSLATPMATTTGSSVTTTSPDPAPTGFYLPTYIPDGYDVTNVRASVRNEPAEFGNGWLKRDPFTGDFVGKLVVSVRPLMASETIPPWQPNATVHGLAAATASSANVGAEVRWHETGAHIYLFGDGMTEAEVRQAAESIVVDGATFTAAFGPAGPPDGYVEGPTSDRLARTGDPRTPSNIVEMSLGLARRDGSPGGFISLSTSANTGGSTLDDLQVGERRTVGNVERKVLTNQPDELGTFTAISWLDRDIIFSVTGRATPEEMLKFASGVQPTTQDQVIAFGKQITDQTLNMTMIGRAAFTDGLVVSVPTNGRGAAGLCLEAPSKQCFRSITESSLAGGDQNAVFQLITVNGTRFVLGWHKGSLEPKLGPPITPTVSYSIPISPITQIVLTDMGHFMQIRLAPGEYPPSITYGSETYNVGGWPTPTIVDA